MLISDNQSTGVSPNSSNLGSQSQFAATWKNSDSSISGSVGGSYPSATYSVASVFASGSSTGEFGALVGAFPAFGSSTSSTNASTISPFGSPSLFSSPSVQSSSSSRFGFQPQDGGFGQSSISFAPRSFGSTDRIATLGHPTAFAGNYTPGFAIFSSPLSSQSTFGASAALGSSTSSTPPAASISALASPSLFSSGSSVFSSNSGSLFRQTSSLANQISGSSTVFGPSNQSTLGNNGTPFSNMHNSVTHACQCASSLGSSSTSLSGFTIPAFSSPIAPSFTTFKFGKSDGHESLNSKTIFDQPNSTFIANKKPGSFTSGPRNTKSTVKTEGFFQSADKCQYRGSRVASYVGTPEVDGIFTHQTSNKVASISAMPTYKDKSHEELRLEDYQLSWEKGSSVFKKNSGILFQQTQPAPVNISGSLTKFSPSGQSTFVNNDALVSGVDNSVSHGFKNFNCSMTPSFHFAIPKFCSHTADSVSNMATGHRNITSTFSNKELGLSTIECQCQGSRTASYAVTPEAFADVNIPTSGNIVSISAMPAYEHKSCEELRLEDYQLTREKGTTSGFSSGMNNNMTVSSSKLQFLLQPSVGITNGSYEPTIIQNQPNISRATSTGPGLQPGVAPLSQKTQTAFSSNTAPINISYQSSADPCAGISSQKVYKQESGSQNNLTIGWSPVTNPFGAEPTLQISFDPPVSTTTIQYGISCLSVNDNPSPVKRSSTLTVRHLSSSRNKVTINKYKPESNHKKAPFYEEGLSDAYKFKAPFIPRKNARALLLCPTEGWSAETKSSKSSVLEEKSTGISNEGSKQEDGGSSLVKVSLSHNGIFDDNGSQEGKMHIIFEEHQADEDTSVYTNDEDVQAIMPKLQCPEYYTIPSIDELAAKERAEAGFCRHVKDFVIGKHGYGSIKFLGETDVTNLDLESLVQFNHREVIVYMDESKKPLVGKGLNKPAEISLLNVKCINKYTGRAHVVDGPMVDKYRQMLIKKGAEQGAEFVSYDPVAGEWKFRVPHF